MTEATLDLSFINTRDHYSDGESEQVLFDLFSGENSDARVDEVLNGEPSWPLRYHLSPVRENLLSWYPFQASASLLEVGAGCGAVTGLFCKKLSKVVAVELTTQRAKVLHARHRRHGNLRVIAGNLNDIKFDGTFDFVTSIGVLEYAGRFTHSEHPYRDFLARLRDYLSPTGKLIVAIENRFGLKYWAGAKEDHTNRNFDSIEDYPSRPGIRTFGREELSTLLRSVGLNTQEFYYPMPDYKLPTEVFSDRYLPSFSHNIRPGLLPAVDFSNSREYLFDEKLAMDSIIRNDGFPFFANSFLVIASR